MLDLYYASEKPLPLNIDGLCRLIQAKAKPERDAVDTVLEEFFQRTEDGWRNARADLEIAKAQEKSGKAKASAAQRWQCDGNANAMRTHSEGNAKAGCEGNAPNNQEPITKNQEPRTREKSAQRSRGSRLPSGWFPTEPLKAWAEKERSDLDVMVVIAKFRDYWIAVPGVRGCKLDWDATFRNWVRAEKSGGKSTQIDYEALAARLEAEEKQRAGV